MNVAFLSEYCTVQFNAVFVLTKQPHIMAVTFAVSGMTAKLAWTSFSFFTILLIENSFIL